MSQLEVTYRPVVPEDLDSLRAAHEASFPIDYESHFYDCVIHERDSLFSWAAVCRDDAQEHFIGFVTARTFKLDDCSITDRACMNLESRLLDQETAVYILTLGVAEGHRQLGIASRLIQLVVAHAQRQLSRAVYLHVIEYNTAALRFYQKNGFEELTTLRNFYYIGTGRQPNPEKQTYDAFLYAVIIDVSLNASPLAFLNAACAPFRSLLGQCQACMPWAAHHSNYFSHAVRQRSAEPTVPAYPSQQGSALWRLFNRL